MLGPRLYGEIRNVQFEKQFERDFMRRTLKLVQEYQALMTRLFCLTAVLRSMYATDVQLRRSI